MNTIEYPHGFTTNIQNTFLQKGLTEETVHIISSFRKEPEWLLDFRLAALHTLRTLKEPQWSEIQYKITYEDLAYFATSRTKKAQSLSEIDPQLLKTYERLGIPLEEQKRLSGVAIDAIFDSTSIFTTYQDALRKIGVIFCSFGEAVQKYPKLVQQYLSSVVPANDNYFACLNSAVFSDGSFVYVPAGVVCPIDLTSYFRINTRGLGQFERTLIIAEKGSSVRYLEGCSAPQFLESQLHAAVVEIIAMDNAEVRYATVQNWYPGDENGQGGCFEFCDETGALQRQGQQGQLDAV